jgi:hypothetical protein
VVGAPVGDAGAPDPVGWAAGVVVVVAGAPAGAGEPAVDVGGGCEAVVEVSVAALEGAADGGPVGPPGGAAAVCPLAEARVLAAPLPAEPPLAGCGRGAAVGAEAEGCCALGPDPAP